MAAMSSNSSHLNHSSSSSLRSSNLHSSIIPPTAGKKLTAHYPTVFIT
jgi:hypothetical protein